MTQKELIDHFVEKVNTGQIAFDQIRKELEGKGLAEEDIRAIVRLVDNEVLHRIDSKTRKNIFEQLVRVGFVATAVGLILTVGSFAGLFTSGNTFMIVLAYGPLFGGLAMIFAGLRAKSRKNSTRAPKPMAQRNRQNW